jgi:peptide chain release factor 2
MERPDFWVLFDRAQGLISEHKSLRILVSPFLDLKKDLTDNLELLELLDPSKDSDVTSDIEASILRISEALSALEKRTLYRESDDERPALLTIQAGAGGVDAMDWAEQLERMYTRWLSREGFEVTISDRLKGSEAGIHYSEIQISGPYAYGRLRGERGVHRIQHISAFDANGKKQTSFAAVDVVAIHPEKALEILEQDLEVETMRSGGPGGQGVQTTDSAVRVRHLPTGIIVRCQSQRSQIQNKKTALGILASKLRRLEDDKKEKRQKLEASFGHQTRTYVLEPYQLVKDHRSGFETRNVKAILDGDLNALSEACLRKSI